MTDEGTDNETVDGGIEDLDEGESDVKTYECGSCGYRMDADHQPGECPKCGGSMIDLSVSRE